MLYETTSQDIKTEFSPGDAFLSGSSEGMGSSGIFGPWYSSFREKTLERYFYAIPNLQSILEDYRSPIAIDPFPQSKSETTLTEESFRKVRLREILEDMSNMIEKIIQEEEDFKRIDKVKLLKSISEMLSNFNSEQLKIPRDELFRRIRRIITLESVFGMLSELSPEEIKDFDEMVKRRPLFE